MPDEATVCDRVEPVQAMVELMQHLAVHEDDLPWCFRAVETIIHTVPIVRLRYEDAPAGLTALTRQSVSGTRNSSGGLAGPIEQLVDRLGVEDPVDRHVAVRGAITPE